MRRLITLIVIGMTLLALAPPVAADTEPVPRESFTTVGFDAGSSVCDRNGCTDTFIRVEVQTTNSGDTFSFLCLDQFISRARTGTFRGGCTEDLSVAIAADLSSATLAPTTLQVCSRNCEDVVVSAELAAVGEAASFSSRFSESDGTCRFTFAERGQRRPASGSLSIDDETLSVDGSIFSRDTTVTSRCR